MTEKFPWITYSDLWILGGVAAIQEMQGPIIPYRPGRSDRDVSFCTPDGRLPDATKGSDHLRNIFNRMGFNDQEIVALSGAHALGRCHTDRSGFDGPWTFSPTVLTNDYYRLLVEEKWQWKKWNGPKQVSRILPSGRSKTRLAASSSVNALFLLNASDPVRQIVRGCQNQDPDDASYRHGSGAGQEIQARHREIRQGQCIVLPRLLRCRHQAV